MILTKVTLAVLAPLAVAAISLTAAPHASGDSGGDCPVSPHRSVPFPAPQDGTEFAVG